MDNIVSLPTKLVEAENPSKKDLLELLDRLRAEVERNEVLALVCIPIKTEDKFCTRFTGKISTLELCGLLGRAWLDAQASMG